jgi:hypothetical protein
VKDPVNAITLAPSEDVAIAGMSVVCLRKEVNP